MVQISILLLVMCLVVIRLKWLNHQDEKMRRSGFTGKELRYIIRVYESCKTKEQRDAYFAWEERLFYGKRYRK